jgi:hypothetical protein
MGARKKLDNARRIGSLAREVSLACPEVWILEFGVLLRSNRDGLQIKLAFPNEINVFSS